MTYLSDRKHNRKQYRYYIAGFLLIVALVYFWPRIKSAVYSHIEPTVISMSTSKNAFFRIPSAIHLYFSSRNDLEAKNKALALTIEHLENQLADSNGRLKESDLLTASGVGSPASTLVMYPLMQDITTIYSSVLLSKGFKDGVIENDVVYLHGKQPVCTIVEIYDRTSLCKLLSAHGEISEAVVASSSIALTLVGNGGGTFIAEVPRNTQVSQGQRIYLKSDPSMMVGTVSDVVRNDQAVAWKVYVRGAYSPITSTVFYMTK